jgi:rhamnulokinase
VGGTFRILKNIAGLWILQQCRRAWSKSRDYSYPELVAMAETAGCESVIDPDAPAFFNPADMPRAVAGSCRETGQPVPETTGDFVRVVLRSLALAHRYTLEELLEVSPFQIKRVHIVGGGAQNALLCRFTAGATGLPVHAGPVEATAAGNLLVQAVAAGEVRSLKELREIVRRSFEVVLYEPEDTGRWNEAYGRFLKLRGRAGIKE